MPAASPLLRRIDEKDVAMKLIWKFNLVLLGIFVLGFAISGYVSYRVLQANAREEIVQNARLMMEAALSSRTYTNTQVKPLLETQLKYAFLPQTVPAYAATEVFNEMRKKHPDYGYKEATLNPTNPRDRASDWEADIVNAFRQSKDNVEMVGERDTPTGRALYLARPIQITSGACLVCHSTIEVAPKTMVDLYGTANGFGWKMQEVIGAQVVSVPIRRAEHTFRTFMLSLAAVFAVTFVLLNAMLHVMVIRRVTRLAAIADQVSLGNLDAGEFRTRSRDEIGILTEALGRMKVSLVQAMKMLE
jgi:protein-histidine pros-kinase